MSLRLNRERGLGIRRNLSNLLATLQEQEEIETSEVVKQKPQPVTHEEMMNHEREIELRFKSRYGNFNTGAALGIHAAVKYFLEENNQTKNK